MNKRSVCLIVAILFFSALEAQQSKSFQNTFLEAEYFFMSEDYSDALPYYLQLYEQLPDNSNLAYRIGVCYLNLPGKKNLSVDFLETASKNMSAKHKEGTISQTEAPYDALYDLAIAYRINYKFTQAKETLIKFSGTLLPDDKENLDFINHEIAVCDMAKELIDSPVEFSETNIGDLFNDEKANFNPLITADGKTFAYMVTLKFYDAIMLSNMVNGSWTPPYNISPDLQTEGDIFISCLADNGKLLLFSQDDNYDSDIYSSSFNGASWTRSLRLNKNINTKYWESHGFVSEDGNRIIFASDRSGGFGGLDLYISRKTDGDWGPAINLGPSINTQFNEDRPFLIKNGETLFFSSQGHNNMGGFDLFRSDLQSNGLWSIPQNLGYPLNTPDDNIFFMPSSDGKSGYISVLKESGGYGKEDIYKITFK